MASVPSCKLPDLLHRPSRLVGVQPCPIRAKISCPDGSCRGAVIAPTEALSFLVVSQSS